MIEIWKWTGYTMVFFLSGLQALSVMERLSEVLKRFMNADCLYRVDIFCDTYQKLPDSFRQAVRELPPRDTSFGMVGSEARLKELSQKITSQVVNGTMMEPFERALEKLDAEEIRRSVNDIFDLLGQERYGRLAEDLPEKAGQQKRWQDSPYVRRALGVIESGYPQDISLNDVAEETGISAGYLSTLFKREMGCSFSEYLSRVRVERAIELMKGGQDNIRQIASECGFRSYEYFFEVFKRVTGATPKEYRRAKAGPEP